MGGLKPHGQFGVNGKGVGAVPDDAEFGGSKAMDAQVSVHLQHGPNVLTGAVVFVVHDDQVIRNVEVLSCCPSPSGGFGIRALHRRPSLIGVRVREIDLIDHLAMRLA